MKLGKRKMLAAVVSCEENILVEEQAAYNTGYNHVDQRSGGKGAVRYIIHTYMCIACVFRM